MSVILHYELIFSKVLKVVELIEYHESGEDVSGNTKRLGGNTTQNPEALKWQYKPTAEGRRFVLAHFRADGWGWYCPQSLGIPRYVRARLMVFTLLLGKLKPSRRPREAIWVGNTYPLGGAKNFTMLQEVRIDPIRTPWEKLKIFTMLQEVRIDPIRTPWETSKVFIIVSKVTYPGICTR